ncbi:MAG: hydroxymethylbilane synthase, partial [Merdibacter sp.]
MNIRIATRGSRLALCQSEIVRKKIMSLDPSARCELVIVRTAGDRNQHAPLHTLGGKGVFVREIEECLLNGEADLAVHSMKDMPAELPQG